MQPNDPLELKWDNTQWSGISSFDVWIKVKAIGFVVQHTSGGSSKYSLEVLSGGVLEAKFDTGGTDEIVVTTPAPGLKQMPNKDGYTAFLDQQGQVRDPTQEWQSSAWKLQVSQDSQWTHVAVGVSTEAVFDEASNEWIHKRRLTIWMDGNVAASDTKVYSPVTSCKILNADLYSTDNSELNATWVTRCTTHATDKSTCESTRPMVDYLGEKPEFATNAATDPCVYDGNVIQKKTYDKVVIGSSTFAGDLDNIRFMDGLIATNALNNARVRQLRTSIATPPSFYTKALLTFDDTKTVYHSTGIFDALSTTKSNIKEIVVAAARPADTADQSFVNTNSFRSTPTPTLPTTVITTSLSKPAQPSTMAVNADDVLSWRSDPLDFGGTHPTVRFDS